MNFFLDPPLELPYEAEAELLLSPLFREAGEGLYEIDSVLRDPLLAALVTRFGADRLARVAILLERYTDQTPAWRARPEFEHAQRLTALSLLDPQRAAEWLTTASAGPPASDVGLGRDWYVAMTERLRRQPSPVQTVNRDVEQAIAALTAGEPASQTAALRRLGELALLPGADLSAIGRALAQAAEPASQLAPAAKPVLATLSQLVPLPTANPPVPVGLEFGILGPTDVSRDGRAIPLGSAKQRTLLAALILEAGRVVPVDRLVDTLWETDPPRTAADLVQGYVSRLRRSLGAGSPGGGEAVIATGPAGYLLQADPAAVDWLRFEALLRRGREELADGRPAAAAASLGTALELWRGPALADVDSPVLRRTAGARLEELRLTALEERIEADLLLGRHEQVLAELRELVDTDPTRDRLVGQLMVALYRCGRQAEALDRYRAYRSARRDQLGLDPSATLERLERSILRGDPALDPPPVVPAERRVPVGRPPRPRVPTADPPVGLEFGILGPIDVSRDGRAIPLGSAKQRTLLATLILEAGRVVPVDRLVDTLWETDPPRTAADLVQGYVSRLRRSLSAVAGAGAGGEDGVIATRPAGYLLQAGPGTVDWRRFEALVRQGREELTAGQPEKAAASLRTGLGLWRGPALADVVSAVLVRTAGARLEELRLTALEERIEADLLLGRHEQVVAELRELVGTDPTRDRLVGQLMRALYRCGRQAEALERYRAARAARLDQLGLDASPVLERLERSILRGDPALDPPPVAAPSPRRGPVGRLPRPRDSFIGRAWDLAAIATALRDQQLVTLCGGPGVGKTRLAMEVAGRVAERYLDGVWLVSLATVTDGRLVAQTVTRTLGIREDTARTSTDILVDWLQERRGLLLLDNCEHLVVDCAELIDIVLEHCENVSILATSREPLAVTGERVYPVSPLDLPAGGDADARSVRSAEAVQLFETRAVSVRPGFAVTDANAAAVAGVCRSLDGTPLAIELAAARLRVLTIEQIADQLELLSGGWTGGSAGASSGTGSGRGRKRTLRAAFDWSHNLLSDDERAVFARLSVFAGGFNLAAAEAVAAGGPVTGPQVMRLLETLMEKSLVVGETGTGAAVGEVRFQLLEATRQYAGERLAALGEADDLRRRHAEFFLDLAVRADRDRRGARRVELGRRLAAEYDNITAALLWARDADADDISLQLSAAMGWYWARRPREGLSWVRAALADGRDADPRHRQWALWAAAHLSAHSAPAEALQFSRRSVELALETGDTRSAVYPLLIHGRLVEERGEPDNAVRLHDQALAYAEDAGDTFGTATALRSRGLSRAHAGQHADSERDVTRAAALFAQLGDQVGAMEAQLNLARLALLRDQAPLAERLIRDLLPQLQALVPDEFDTATAHRYLAWIAARTGRWDTVDTELTKSLQLAFRLNAARIVAFDLVLAAMAGDARGMPRRAAVILGAVDTHLHKRAAPLRKAERAERDHLEAALRDQLGEMRLLLLWERGAAVPIKSAVDFALDPTADIPDGEADTVRIDTSHPSATEASRLQP